MSTEPEVAPQRLWLPLQAALLLRGDEHDPNDIEYVPQSALAEVWEKVLQAVLSVTPMHYDHRGNVPMDAMTFKGDVIRALEAARDAALSVGTKENK